MCLSGTFTNALAQTNDKADPQILGDSIVIEQIRILKPANYKPGDILVPKGYLFLLQDNQAQYKILLANRDTLAFEIDSLYRANYALYGRLDSVQMIIDEMRDQVDYLSRKILTQDLQNIRAQEQLSQDWEKFKKIEKDKKVSVLYQFHLLKKWDRVVLVVFGVGVASLGIYLISDLIITNFVNKSASPGVATPVAIPTYTTPTLRIPLNFH